MSKADKPRTRPEVAKRPAEQSADIYDFVQSPEWQKVLKKARVEQEKNLSAREQNGTGDPNSKPDRGGADQSTTSEHAQSTQKPWSERLEEARQKRNAELSDRTDESEEQPRGSSGVQRTKEESGPVSSEQPIHGNTSPEQEAAKSTPLDQRAGQSNSVGDTGAGDDVPEDDQTGAGMSLRLSSEEVDYRLSKKLLQRLEDHQRTRRRVRLGLLALGCTIGAMASSAVFLALFGWETSGPPENAVTESTRAVTANTASDDVVQSDALQSDVSGGADGEIVISADLFDASSWPASPDTGVSETEDLNSIASLTPPLSEVTEGAVGVEPTTPSAAPSILSYVPALEQPLLPVGGAGYLPRREANPSFLPYEDVPEFFVASIAMVDEISTTIDPIEITAEPATPTQRAPSVSSQVVSLQPLVPVASAARREALPKQIQDIQPDQPLSVDPIENVLKTVASDPSIQLEDVALNPASPQSPALQLRPNPLGSTEQASLPAEDTAALPDEVAPSGTVPGDGGAAFRLYAPNKLSKDAVDSVVAELTTTGHELSGTARVGFRVSQSNVRFYHSQDAAKAAALAKDAGALLRDFTGSKSKTPSGVVELYLAGEGFGQAPVKRATKRIRQNTTAGNPVNQLRSQVLKKLRTKTN